MKVKIKKIAGITVTITDYGDCPEHIKQKFSSIEDAVRDMRNRDVLYKSVRINNKLINLQIEKTDEAIDNWHENFYDGGNRPTGMWK